MQVFSSKIKNGIESVGSTPLFLSNQPITEVKMTTSNLPSNSKSIKICSISDCGVSAHSSGMCKKHYTRWKRHGNPLIVKLTFTDKCSVDGCSSTNKIKKDLCNKHYLRLKRYGDVHYTKQNMGNGETAEERFWDRVNKTSNQNGCWEWQGSKNEFGYGVVSVKGVRYRAHRYAWLLKYGELPSQMLLHSCDNTSCVNPEHLREGDYIENTKDRVERERTVRGEKQHSAKLTESDVLEIDTPRLNRSGYSQGFFGNS